MLLTKITYTTLPGGGDVRVFWTACPEEFRIEDGYSHIGAVSSEEILENVSLAEAAFCGYGRCCRDTQDLRNFARWLINLGYPEHIAIFAARSIEDK